MSGGVARIDRDRRVEFSDRCLSVCLRQLQQRRSPAKVMLVRRRRLRVVTREPRSMLFRQTNMKRRRYTSGNRVFEGQQIIAGDINLLAPHCRAV